MTTRAKLPRIGNKTAPKKNQRAKDLLRPFRRTRAPRTASPILPRSSDERRVEDPRWRSGTRRLWAAAQTYALSEGKPRQPARPGQPGSRGFRQVGRVNAFRQGRDSGARPKAARHAKRGKYPHSL